MLRNLGIFSTQNAKDNSVWDELQNASFPLEQQALVLDLGSVPLSERLIPVNREASNEDCGKLKRPWETLKYQSSEQYCKRKKNIEFEKTRQ